MTPGDITYLYLYNGKKLTPPTKNAGVPDLRVSKGQEVVVKPQEVTVHLSRTSSLEPDPPGDCCVHRHRCS